MAWLDLLSETSIIVTLVIAWIERRARELGRKPTPAEVVVVDERNRCVRRDRVVRRD
jgi:hypothetical protein